MDFKWVMQPNLRIITTIWHLPLAESSNGDLFSPPRSNFLQRRLYPSGSGQKPPGRVPHCQIRDTWLGESDDEARRVMVLLIYFNHPLFVELLEEAERVHGFDHPSGISIPCGYSKFEKVRMQIDAWDGGFRSCR